MRFFICLAMPSHPCRACADFLRVGSLRRMDKAVLPFSLHCCDSSKATAVDELKEMLKAAASSAEAAVVECVLHSHSRPLPYARPVLLAVLQC